MEEVWDGTGMFVFTSSGSVYAESKGGVVTETSPIDERKVDSPLRSECLLALLCCRKEGRKEGVRRRKQEKEITCID